MLHWLHSLLPHIPHYGFVLVFIIVFLNNIGVPMPGKTILIGVGVILGRSDGALPGSRRTGSHCSGRAF